jgi:O-antigen/teichoic acid export membrane protein
MRTLLRWSRLGAGWLAAYLVGMAAFLLALGARPVPDDLPGLLDIRSLLLLVGILTAPLALPVMLVGEFSGERRLSYYVLQGAIAAFVPAFLFVMLVPRASLAAACAGAIGGATYWAVAGRRAGPPRGVSADAGRGARDVQSTHSGHSRGR